jgi:hypothetical protein
VEEEDDETLKMRKKPMGLMQGEIERYKSQESWQRQSYGRRIQRSITHLMTLCGLGRTMLVDVRGE